MGDYGNHYFKLISKYMVWNWDFFIIWLLLNSTFGDDLFGRYNVFSYVFRSYEQGGTDWIPGKVLGFVLAILMMFVLLPQTMKRRK